MNFISKTFLVILLSCFIVVIVKHQRKQCICIKESGSGAIVAKYAVESAINLTKSVSLPQTVEAKDFFDTTGQRFAVIETLDDVENLPFISESWVMCLICVKNDIMSGSYFYTLVDEDGYLYPIPFSKEDFSFISKTGFWYDLNSSLTIVKSGDIVFVGTT